MKKCPKCNYLIYNDFANFCKKCGADVRNQPTVMPGNTEPDTPQEPIISQLNESPQFTYAPKINGFFAFVLWMIVIGGILTPILGMIKFEESAYASSVWLLLSDVSVYLFTPIFAIYTVVSTYRRRSGAVTLLKTYLTYILCYKILLLLLSGFSSAVSEFLSLIWNLIFLLYICLAEKVKDNFPQETRKTSVFDKIMIWIYILVPTITFVFGIVDIIF